MRTFKKDIINRTILLCTLPIICFDLTACFIFQQSTESPHEAQQRARQEEANRRHENTKKNMEICKSGDDTACAEVLTDTHAWNELMGYLESPKAHKKALDFLKRACAGGHQRACQITESEERREQHKAGLARVTAEEVAQIELGQSIEQVNQILRYECVMDQSSMHQDHKGKSVTRASYRCFNTDSSGVLLDLIDSKVTNIVIVGPLPKASEV